MLFQLVFKRTDKEILDEVIDITPTVMNITVKIHANFVGTAFQSGKINSENIEKPQSNLTLNVR